MPIRFAQREPAGKMEVRSPRHDMSGATSQCAAMTDTGGAKWFLKEWRAHQRLTLEQLADAAETSKGYISDLERGLRVGSRQLAERLAQALGITAAQLMSVKPGEDLNGHRTVPLVGHVGAGSEAHFYSSSDEGLGEVECPADIWTPESRAAEIRGTSLGVLFETWLIFYDDVRTPVTSDLIGRLCILGLPNGQVLVKQIRKSRTAGLYHLLSNNEEPMLDQEVTWAAKVKDMRPR